MNLLPSFAFFLILLLPSLTTAQSLRTITQLPAKVDETSGIELTDANSIWTFNDSGGEPELYLCDTTGALLRTVRILNANNRDWEDITQDSAGNFYIGNIGNNDNDETDLSIFKIPSPNSFTGNSVTAEVIQFSFSDQTSFPPPDDSLYFDCEALMWTNGHLYLATKNRTSPFDGLTHLYRLPDSAGQYVAEKIGTFDTGGTERLTYWITAGDMNDSGTLLTLLSSDKLWLFYDFVGDDFFGGNHLEINLGAGSQKEAICFVNDTLVYLTDEELASTFGRNLYEFPLPTVITDTLIESLSLPTLALQIGPNPFLDQLTIEGEISGLTVELVELSGRIALSEFSESDHLSLPTSQLPAGEYVLCIRDNTGRLLGSKKVICRNE